MYPVFAVIAGAVLIITVLWDSFETVILPRRVTRRVRLARLYFRITWRIWSGISNRFSPGRYRETYLSYYGPLSILFLLFIWAAFMIFGYGLLFWAHENTIGSSLSKVDLLTCLYLSGTTFFTLGLGDVQPMTGTAKLLVVLESGMGFGFLAIMFSYLPMLNQSFSRREANISLLDARAGSPPSASEMILRQIHDGRTDALTSALSDWEKWSAELLESHLSYPLLTYFRSQHDNQSWIAALTCILDTCVFSIVNIEGACSHQARLTFAMARHAIVDLALVLRCPPFPPQTKRLSISELNFLRTVIRTAGLKLYELEEKELESRMGELRDMYEPYIHSLSERLCMAVPSWIGEKTLADNWQVSAWGLAPGMKEPGRGNHFR